MAQRGIYQDIYELQLRPQEERMREAVWYGTTEECSRC